jgi:Protein of unknown function (DUF3866)
MATWRKGRVTEVLEVQSDLVRAQVDADGQHIEVAAFPSMVGPIEPGDMLVVNTTGLDLELGTGGAGFVLWNLDGKVLPQRSEGHIVKLRYTPWQTEVAAVEAPESPHHDKLVHADSLEGMPVVVCTLHSQMAAAVAGIKATRPRARVGYLMTDGAALPLAWSRVVRALEQAGLLEVTCTAGHAFGGDLEAVNVFSGLVALRHVAGVEAAVVAMGPGGVGTGTALGFTGMEQGQVLDAVTALGGRAIAGLRISFADQRARHRGVSHHSLTALRVAAREPTVIVLPRLPAERLEELRGMLVSEGLDRRHEVIEADGGPGIELLRARRIELRSMGRSFDDVRELFLAGAAAGAVAAHHL